MSASSRTRLLHQGPPCRAGRRRGEYDRRGRAAGEHARGRQPGWRPVTAIHPRFASRSPPPLTLSPARWRHPAGRRRNRRSQCRLPLARRSFPTRQNDSDPRRVPGHARAVVCNCLRGVDKRLPDASPRHRLVGRLAPSTSGGRGICTLTTTMRTPARGALPVRGDPQEPSSSLTRRTRGPFGLLLWQIMSNGHAAHPSMSGEDWTDAPSSTASRPRPARRPARVTWTVSCKRAGCLPRDCVRWPRQLLERVGAEQAKAGHASSRGQAQPGRLQSLTSLRLAWSKAIMDKRGVYAVHVRHQATLSYESEYRRCHLSERDGCDATEPRSRSTRHTPTSLSRVQAFRTTRYEMAEVLLRVPSQCYVDDGMALWMNFRRRKTLFSASLTRYARPRTASTPRQRAALEVSSRGSDCPS